jgi:hypothetical protein|tara:strand:- start:413 stop:523 length:111 start_codon:yes stop_codon:yes gene_type:complete
MAYFGVVLGLKYVPGMVIFTIMKTEFTGVKDGVSVN